jgi:hypothetical protein
VYWTRTSTEQDRTREDLKKTDTEILRADRIRQAKELLRSAQKPEYRTEKITSSVYVV